MIQSKSRLVALGLTLAVASLAVVPAQAGDAFSPTHASTAAKGPLAASAEARVARLDTSAVATAAPAATGASDHKPFFKSGKGVAVILLFVGGAAWTIASARDKRIHSPIR